MAIDFCLFALSQTIILKCLRFNNLWFVCLVYSLKALKLQEHFLLQIRKCLSVPSLLRILISNEG